MEEEVGWRRKSLWRSTDLPFMVHDRSFLPASSNVRTSKKKSVIISFVLKISNMFHCFLPAFNIFS